MNNFNDDLKYELTGFGQVLPKLFLTYILVYSVLAIDAVEHLTAARISGVSLRLFTKNSTLYRKLKSLLLFFTLFTTLVHRGNYSFRSSSSLKNTSSKNPSIAANERSDASLLYAAPLLLSFPASGFVYA